MGVTTRWSRRYARSAPRSSATTKPPANTAPRAKSPISPAATAQSIAAGTFSPSCVAVSWFETNPYTPSAATPSRMPAKVSPTRLPTVSRIGAPLLRDLHAVRLPAQDAAVEPLHVLAAEVSEQAARDRRLVTGVIEEDDRTSRCDFLQAGLDVVDRHAHRALDPEARELLRVTDVHEEGRILRGDGFLQRS